MATRKISGGDPVVFKTLACPSITVAGYGSSTVTFDITSVVPDGYYRQFVYCYFTGNNGLVQWYCALASETTCTIGLRNVTSSSITASPMVYVVSLKT